MATEPVAELIATPDDGTIDRRRFVVRAAVGLSTGLLADARRAASASAYDATPTAGDAADPPEREEGDGMDHASEHHALAEDDAEAVWFLGTLATIKGVGSRTGGTLAAVEFTHPSGFATPLHVHHKADEAFYVLAGGIRGVCGDREWRATTGAFVWLPRGVPHGYAVDGDETLRTLAICAPAGFDRFVVEGGQPARERALPPPTAPDLAKLDAAGAKYSIETVGPPVHFADDSTG